MTAKQINSLAIKAYNYGRKEALKANRGEGYNREWKYTPICHRVGFRAMVRFILNVNGEQGENPKKLPKGKTLAGRSKLRIE